MINEASYTGGETSERKRNVRSSSLIREVVDSSRILHLDPRARQRLSFIGLSAIECHPQNLLLSCTAGNEGDAVRMIQHWVGERDARGGRLRTVDEGGNPNIFFQQERM